MPITISVQDVAKANRFLQSLEFIPKGPNPEWYQSIVTAMVAQPGTQLQIEENSYFVGKALNLRLKDRRNKGSHPNFHFGDSGVREYVKKLSGVPSVGKTLTFDDLEAYCYTHERSYAEAGNRTEPCRFTCSYGFRYQNKPTTELIASF